MMNMKYMYLIIFSNFTDINCEMKNLEAEPHIALGGKKVGFLGKATPEYKETRFPEEEHRAKGRIDKLCVCFPGID